MLELSLSLLVLSVLCLFLLLRKLGAPAVSDCEDGWFDEFSVARYRPMLRLLREDDYEFLGRQRGLDPAVARKLRAERRKIFRSYLRSMVRDFHRLHLAAKMMVVYGHTDRSDLASQLLGQRIRFQGCIALLQMRLALHTAGIGTANAQGLLDSLEQFRLNVAQLGPHAATA
ncbi:MAG TPA: hypothetical protein VMZ52_19820 [Bryobacteraceae bacterium]|nr:hypothetical protein [Bryobacteraceae bacterium]